MSKGPIRVKLLDDPADASSPDFSDNVSNTIALPPPDVIAAGVKKFREYANLHWPAGRVTGTGELQLRSFDHRNDQMLQIALAMTFVAMRQASRGHWIQQPESG